MLNLRTLPLGLVALLSLNIGACSDKNKTEIQKTTETLQSISLQSSGKVDYAAMLSVKKRVVKEADADAALKDLGFFTQTDSLKWAKRDGKSGTYTFDTVELALTGAKSDSFQTLTMDRLKLSGVHMVDGKGTFDRADMSGVKTLDEDVVLSMKSASFSRPSPAMAKAFLSALSDLSLLEDVEDFKMTAESKDGPLSFGAGVMSDLALKSDTTTINLADVKFAKDPKSGLVFTDLNKFAMAAISKDDAPFALSFEKGLAHGVTETFLSKTLNTDSPLSNLNASVDAGYSEMSFENLNVSLDTLSMSTEGWQSQVKTSGDVQTSTQVLKPLSLAITEGATSAEIMTLQKGLADMGYENIVLSGQQITELNTETDRARVRDSFLTLEDGFTLTFNSDMSGINAMTQKMQATDKPSPDMLNDLVVHTMDISLTDNSLVNRVFDLVAAKQGTSVGVLKMQAKSVLMLGSLGAKTKEDGVVISNLAGALGEFIENGGTLNVKMQPEAALTVANFQGVATGDTPLSALGLTAETITPK